MARLDADLPRAFGRFQLLRRLGSGGCGSVFLADDPSLNRQVAIKIPHGQFLLSPEARQRFVREAQALARLSHPQIVTVFESGEIDELPYLVMEFCGGGSLNDLMSSRSERLSLRECAELVCGLADALGHAHRIGLLHRDVKPGNVLLEKVEGFGLRVERTAEVTAGQSSSILNSQPSTLNLSVKLSDFGLAKWLDADDSVRTRTGATVGTPQYMAPEQARHDAAALCPATDVHGVGVLLFEMLTGQLPYAGKSLGELFQQLESTEPLALRGLRSDVPRDLETICLTCLAKEPAQRYANGDELAAELRRFLAGEAIAARRIGVLGRLGKWSRRHPERAALCVIALIATMLGGVGVWKSSRFAPHADDASRSSAQHQVVPDMAAPTAGRTFTVGGDVVVAPIGFDGSHPVTLEAWMQSQQADGVMLSFGGLINLHSGDGSEAQGPKVNVNLSEQEVFIGQSNQPLDHRKWQHLAVVYDGQSVRLFVDGHEMAIEGYLYDGEKTELLDAPFAIQLKPLWPGLGLTIGSNDRGSSAKKRYPFVGRIREVRISAAARYTQTFEPQSVLTVDTQTTALYRLSDSSADSLIDESGHHGPALVLKQR
jgi:hypothetical protein